MRPTPEMNADLNGLSPYVRTAKIETSHGLSCAYINAEYVFTYIFEGYGCFFLEGKKFTVTHGNLILMPPYMLHVIQAPSDVAIVQYILHFDSCYTPKRKGSVKLKQGMTFRKFLKMTNSTERILASLPSVLTVPPVDQKKTDELFLRLKNEFDNKIYGYELIVKAIMLEILSVFFRNAGVSVRPENTRTKGWRNLEKAILFIQNNMHRPLTIQEISKTAGLSPNYCCQLFKHYTHTTMHRYLNLIRIQKAKLLIDKAELNFSQIADVVGFSSIHLFSRIFKKMEGVPPLQYSKSRTENVLARHRR